MSSTSAVRLPSPLSIRSTGLQEVVVLGQERKRLAPRPEEIEAPKG